MNKLNIEQEVLLVNSSRNNVTENLVKIETIGKKYFTVENCRSKFLVENLQEVTDFNICYKVYLNPDDYYLEKEKNSLISKINVKLRNGISKTLTLDNLILIHNLLT